MKRLVSVLLCLSMVLTLLTPVAFAAESDADAMRAALLTVKSRVDIPSAYSQFEYQSGTTDGELYWEFYWTNPNGGFLSVKADQNGRILRYQHNPSDVSEGLPPKMTKAEAIEAAKKQLEKSLPEISDKLVFERVSVNRYNHTYDISFVRQEHAIPVPEQTVTVRMDYRTQACTMISSSVIYDAEIKEPGTLVGSETVFPLWAEMADLTLEYEIDLTGNANLWYTVKGEIRPIDAESGEPILEEVIWEKGVTEDSATAGGATNETFRDQLSPEEQEKHQELKDLISKEKADAIVRAYTSLALGKNDSLYSAHLYRDTNMYGAKQEKRSYWSLTYSGPVTKGESPEQAYACVDAKTGTLLSFRAYRDTTKEKRKLGETAAISKAKAMLKAAASDVSDHTQDAVRTDSEKDPIPSEYRFRFGRVQDGIPVSNNQITVSVNSISGKVTEYSRNWTENVTFEAADSVISTETAQDVLQKHQAPKLAYYTQTVYLYDIDSSSETVDWYYSGIPTKKKITLSYLGPDDVRRIDAISGEVESWNQTQEVKEETYSDIKGHFAQREIQLLLDIGILPSGAKFEPNRPITQLDLLCFLFAARQQYVTYNAEDQASVDELYKTAIAQGIITAGEKYPSKPVTRADAARMIVSCTNYGKLAKNPGIFRTDYRDAASIPQKDLGYVVIAKALGILQGSGGKFYATRAMTRGEAICMICKYLAVKG